MLLSECVKSFVKLQGGYTRPLQFLTRKPIFGILNSLQLAGGLRRISWARVAYVAFNIQAMRLRCVEVDLFQARLLSWRRTNVIVAREVC